VKVVILTGGLGIRRQPNTAFLPKPMEFIDIGNKSSYRKAYQDYIQKLGKI
jgi:NDP-sugar pyrophosphorylase family protein